MSGLSRQNWTRTLAGLLVGWAVLLAIGTLFYGQPDWRRALFVLVAVGTFPTIWWVALSSRRKG